MANKEEAFEVNGTVTQALANTRFRVTLVRDTCVPGAGKFGFGRGVLIARIWTSRPVLQLLSAAMFVLMPTLLIRVGHPSLTFA